MAKVKTQNKQSGAAKQGKKKDYSKKFRFPLQRTNFLILGIGALIIALGYIFMALPDDPDAFLTRTLAPVLLVFSFVVVIPYGLLYKEDKEQKM